MKISNSVKRNISFTLLLVGVACTLAWGWEVAMDPSSGKAWFELVGMMILTYGPLSEFLRLRKLVAQGVMFGRYCAS